MTRIARRFLAWKHCLGSMAVIMGRKCTALGICPYAINQYIADHSANIYDINDERPCFDRKIQMENARRPG